MKLSLDHPVELEEQNFRRLSMFVFLEILSDLSCFLRKLLNLAEENLSYRPRIEEIRENIEHNYHIIKSLESKLQSKIIHQDELYQVKDFEFKSWGN